jgi:acyl-coenzyme A thioesterase PaaI-like protein
LTESAQPLPLQERYAPGSRCFGCGPANERGLRIRSFAQDGVVVAEWRASPEHEAFEGAVNGGIVGALLDCHSNWTAAHHLMGRNGTEQPPSTVTAQYAVRLLRPTPSDRPLRLEARVVEASDDRAVVEARLTADGVACATCRGTFVVVGPGHPAYGRW